MRGAPVFHCSQTALLLLRLLAQEGQFSLVTLNRSLATLGSLYLLFTAAATQFLAIFVIRIKALVLAVVIICMSLGSRIFLLYGNVLSTAAFLVGIIFRQNVICIRVHYRLLSAV
jgi:hypothetical protein